MTRATPETILIGKEGAARNKARRETPEVRALHAAFDALADNLGHGEAAALACRRAKLHTEMAFLKAAKGGRRAAEALFKSEAA